MRKHFDDLVTLTGFGILEAGLYLLHPALALIIGGSALVFAGAIIVPRVQSKTKTETGEGD